MTMPEMKKAIATLRFLLATVNSKDEELVNLNSQFRRQLSRVPNYALQGGNSLDATLSMMGEIQERLDKVVETRTHLTAIKKNVQEELQALDLTEKIESAKRELASLQTRRQDGAAEANLQDEIGELERFIEDASVRAGQAITGESAELDA